MKQNTSYNTSSVNTRTPNIIWVHPFTSITDS